MTSLERDAYRFFLARTKVDERGRACATWGEDEKRGLTSDERSAIRALIAHTLRRQRETVAKLRGCHAVLPCVLRWVRDLDAGELIATHTWRNRQAHMDADLARLAELDTRAEAYRAWREAEARRKRKRLSALKQVAYTFPKALRDVDDEQLRYCDTCGVLAIPETTDTHRGARRGYEGARCLFCQRGDALIGLAEAEGRGLIEYADGFPMSCPVPVQDGYARIYGTDAGRAQEEDES